MIVFFTNFMHYLFIRIIYYIPLNVSSITMPIFSRTIVLVQHLVSSLSLGNCSVQRLRESSRKLCIEQSPKDSDDTRCCANTTVLLNMSIVVLETRIFCVVTVHIKSRTVQALTLLLEVLKLNKSFTGYIT